MMEKLLGAHYSIAGGLHKAFDHADKYQSTTMQIFTQNSHTWKIRELKKNEIDTFLKRKKESGVKKIVSHAGYLINLAGSDSGKREKSFQSMRGELLRAEQLAIENLVLHPGSHTKTSVEEGIERLTESINLLLSDTSLGKTTILFETTAGQGDSVGHRLEHIQAIIERIDRKERVGLCIDTCHIFAAGYDIRSEEGYNGFVNEIDDRFGTESVKCIHLNDSKKALGSRVDRHNHIGEGFVGETAFKLIMNDDRFLHAPKIIETPAENDGVDMNRVNFDRLLAKQ